MKNAYLVSYDLGSPESITDYNKIRDYIKSSFSYWCKPLKSQWMVVSDQKNCDIIKKEIAELLDSNDKLLVLNITNDYYSYFGLSDEIIKWIQSNL